MFFFLESSDREGVGGVFRDLNGQVLLQYSKEVHVNSPMHAEILAFRERILVATASRWTSSRSFLFESDSKSVVT